MRKQRWLQVSPRTLIGRNREDAFRHGDNILFRGVRSVGRDWRSQRFPGEERRQKMTAAISFKSHFQPASEFSAPPYKLQHASRASLWCKPIPDHSKVELWLGNKYIQGKDCIRNLSLSSFLDECLDPEVAGSGGSSFDTLETTAIYRRVCPPCLPHHCNKSFRNAHEPLDFI